MRYLILTACLFLAACANDQYTATSGDPGQMQIALADCKHSVLASYADSHKSLYLGAAVGGALGGFIAATGDQVMSPGDINPAIERCMAAKGYTGTSVN